VIDRVVAWSARHAWFVLAVAVVLAAAGESARRALSRDVVPDLADPQIVLVVEWMGHPAVEVATSVTRELTGALEGVPGSTAVRGSSMAGMAYVDVVFDAAADLGRARENVRERVDRTLARLPAEAHVQVGPAASSTGWVFQYALVDRRGTEPPAKMRRFQEDILRPTLLSIPGVVEVATVGGSVPQIAVEAKPDELRARGLAFTDLLTAIRPALDWHGPASLGFFETQAMPVPRGGTPARVADVATVRLVDDLPSGLADFGGGAAAVGGIVVARRGADLSPLIDHVEKSLARARAWLPPGVELVTVYNRLDLATRIGQTLLRALGEEVAVVVLVVLAFLLHGRSAVVPLMTLPLVLLLTFAGMWLARVPATIMSLGGIGIALGMAVDADVVALEACHRRLEAVDANAPPADVRAKLLAAAGSFAPAILTSLVIAGLTFLPVLAFTGETGRLLRPLAFGKTLVVAAAALVSLTVAPALRDRLLRGPVRPEFENPLTRGLVRVYRPFVDFALRRPVLTIATAVLAVASAVPIVPQLGGEFLPRLDEGDLLFMPTTLPGVSPEQAAEQLRRQDEAIARFPEVATVFGKVGRAETATDPAPFTMAETTIRLVPRSAWPKVARSRWYSDWAPVWLRDVLSFAWPEETELTTAELVENLDRATRLPGWTNAWTAPVRARMDMMATGVRTPVGIRVAASDPARLDQLGGALRALAMRVAGARSAVFESLGGESGVAFDVDAAALVRHGVGRALVESTADLVLTGGHVGEVSWEGKHVPVHVKPDADNGRGPIDQLRAVTVRPAEAGPLEPVPLALVGRARSVTRPAAVHTDRAELVGYVYIDLQEGTDPLGYVERARRELERAQQGGDVALAAGERVDWTGQYELLAAGERRLRWIVPLMAASMLVLLFLQFRSVAEALIVLTSVPFALVGSFWTLFLLGYRMSAPVWVGLLSVVGLAMQTGVVMVVYIDEAFLRRVREGRLHDRADIVAAHAEGTVLRLRPKIMTITTMAAALLPLLWADGAGAEIMKRVAAPMVGGLATSAFLTLEVLPVVYTIWRGAQLARARRTGVSLDAIVGTVPPWARGQRAHGGKKD
jgi:Cu(I)/Ag(I) efflux system membrane protein CusA/SilA